MSTKRTVGAVLSATAIAAFVGLLNTEADAPAAKPQERVTPKSAAIASAEPEVKQTEPEKLFLPMPVAPSVAIEKICPLPGNVSEQDVFADLNFLSAQTDINPVSKFRRLFNSYYESSEARLNKMGIAKAQFSQQLQQSANGAFQSLLQKYPHGTLQAMDQSFDLAKDIKGREIATLRDIHFLRWSMSTLIVNSQGNPDIAQSRAMGGVDIDMLNRLVAKLTVNAYPEAMRRLKELPKDGVFSSEDVANEYAEYLEVTNYVHFGGAHSDAGMDRPEWAEIGFESRTAALGFKRKSDATIRANKERFVKGVLENCAPTDIASAPR